jgi:hypothetical protein
MTECAQCGRPVDSASPSLGLRSGERVYHVACAPSELLDRAEEEHAAILRKGVRYFVEKYSLGPTPGPEVAGAFLELGRALESERARRGRS